MELISDIFPFENTILHLDWEFPCTSFSIFATTANNPFWEINSTDLLIRDSSDSFTPNLNAILFEPSVCFFSSLICFKVGLSMISQSPLLLGNLPEIGSGE